MGFEDALTLNRIHTTLVFGIGFVTILLSYITILLHRLVFYKIENKDTVPNILGTVLGTLGSWTNGFIFALIFMFIISEITRG